MVGQLMQESATVREQKGTEISAVTATRDQTKDQTDAMTATRDQTRDQTDAVTARDQNITVNVTTRDQTDSNGIDKMALYNQNN